MRSRILSAASAVLLLSFFTVSPPNVRAQSGPEVSPGVARVSFIHADVSVQRGDSGESSAATLNTPLVAGDKISTGDGARTEVQLDFANVLRLDERAQANIAALDNNRIQIQLAEGLANFSVLGGSDADVEIDTPNVSVHPVRGAGRYRIQVNPDGDTFITVRQGQAEISTPDGSTTVQSGDFITIHGTGNDVGFQTSRAASSDAFDNWNRDRDRIISEAQSVRNTNRYYTGAADLDAYGTWSEIPDYGRVWRPRVNVGWAPYRSGRWVWEGYYGWTWVSEESWGWAPYHYGRWFDYDGAWVWWPGPVQPYYRPIWAPAYVSFFGFGGGVGLSVGFGGGFGSIGWLPIGPGDYYHPWYGAYRNRYNVVNVTNIYNVHEGFAPLHGGDRFSNLRNVLANDRIRGGVSSVDAGRFGRGAINPRGVSDRELRDGRAMTGNLPVVPTRESLRASDRAASPSARFNNQDRFFSRGAPAARPQPFSEQAAQVRQGIERGGQSGGGNVANGNRNAPTGGLRQQGGVSTVAPSQPDNNNGFRRFGQDRQGPTNDRQGPTNGAQDQRQGGSINRPNAPAVQSQPPNQNQGPAQGGFQRFGQQGSNGAQDQRQGGSVNRPNAPAVQSQPPDNGNRGRGNQSQQPPNQNQGPAQGGSQRFGQSPRTESAPAGNGGPAGNNGRFSQPSSREPLDLNRPIVRERSAPAPSGGVRNAPQPGGESRRAPIRQSAPSVRSAPSAPSESRGPAPSARSESGGGNRGGGGGGGNRGSAPSGGGGRQSGGKDRSR